MNVIIGAGKFSHTHLRVLNELNIKDVTLAKSSVWSAEQKQQFVTTHKNISFLFNNQPCTKDTVLHIVTPSNTHANIIKKYADAKLIFVEKPSIIYNSKIDFEIANAVTNQVYQNDWLSQIQNYRINKAKPKSIYFKYDVKNKEETDHITEIWSHVLNFISIWFEPNCKIHIKHLEFNKEKSSIKVILDNITELSIEASNGLVEKSVWDICIDNEVFNNTLLGGSLLINTFNNMLSETLPLTNWYKSSWMIHRFRLINCYEIFNNDFLNYYKNK